MPQILTGPYLADHPRQRLVRRTSTPDVCLESLGCWLGRCVGLRWE